MQRRRGCRRVLPSAEGGVVGGVRRDLAALQPGRQPRSVTERPTRDRQLVVGGTDEPEPLNGPRNRHQHAVLVEGVPAARSGRRRAVRHDRVGALGRLVASPRLCRTDDDRQHENGESKRDATPSEHCHCALLRPALRRPSRRSIPSRNQTASENGYLTHLSQLRGISARAGRTVPPVVRRVRPEEIDCSRETLRARTVQRRRSKTVPRTRSVDRR